MSGAIVTARIAEDVKRRAEKVIESRGLTPSQVIRGIYNYIGETGTVPDYLSLDEEYAAMIKRQKRSAFIDRYKDNLPPVSFSDDEVGSMLAERAARL